MSSETKKSRVVTLSPRFEGKPIHITMGEFLHGLRYRKNWTLRRLIEVVEDGAYVTDTVDLNGMPSHRKAYMSLNPEDMLVIINSK